ncbi:hypothetical protein BDR07DRAFT_1368289 [Suillus spraguei]|nr:hypothetical protein BDR07DRAFT_1368289 [Suillus spraguei]
MRQLLSARHVTKQFKGSGYYPSIHPESEENESVEAPEQRGNRFIRFLVMLAKGVLSMLVFVWHFPGALARWVKRLIEAYFSKDSEDYTWTQTHSLFVLMGGFMLYVDGEPSLTLRPEYILTLIHAKCIDPPKLTAKQIHDKSKGNAISKGLVMLQVAWFIMQLITRAIYHLKVTQLETGTLAFAVLNFLTYAVWWHKPLDVQCPHPVYWKSTESRLEDHINVPEIDVPARYWILSPVLEPIFELLGSADLPTSRKFRVPTFDGRDDLDYFDTKVLPLAGLLMATIFGAIHCMAWFFTFPTYQEQVLWRMSAVAITFTPWLLLLVDTTSNLVQVVVVWYVCTSVFYASILLYIAARAVLLVLMFTTLRNLPPDTYKAVLWTTLVPHL